MGVPEQANDWAATAETLVALGAPLSGWRPNRRLAREAALAFALRFASTDASLLRSLPVVLARTWRELDWSKLENSARAQGSLALLGMLARSIIFLIGGSAVSIIDPAHSTAISIFSRPARKQLEDTPVPPRDGNPPGA